MNLDLFDTAGFQGIEALGPDAYVLRGFVLPYVAKILPALAAIEAAAPFRYMQTRGGHTMSVALTNCGRLGWVSDRSGYRYSQRDPLTGRSWPAMPDIFRELAQQATVAAGLPTLTPDACLMNCYLPGSKMSLHQDKNEKDLTAPIVSVSLGIPAVFLFGGLRRNDKALRVPLFHGDVVVWGKEDRMRFHGILPIKPAQHPQLGARRINFTFRQAG